MHVCGFAAFLQTGQQKQCGRDHGWNRDRQPCETRPNARPERSNDIPEIFHHNTSIQLDLIAGLHCDYNRHMQCLQPTDALPSSCFSYLRRIRGIPLSSPSVRWNSAIFTAASCREPARKPKAEPTDRMEINFYVDTVSTM